MPCPESEHAQRCISLIDVALSLESSFVNASADTRSRLATLTARIPSPEDRLAVLMQILTGSTGPVVTCLAFACRLNRSGLRTTAAHLSADEEFHETVRLASPFHLASRTAVSKTVVAGHPIGAGGRVHLVLASANRDPRKYAKPDDFYVGNLATPHLAFGAGRHHCPGWQIARLLFESAVRVIDSHRGHRFSEGKVLMDNGMTTVTGLRVTGE